MRAHETIQLARDLRKQMPAPEARLWNALRELKPLGYHFRRQVPLGRYFADFACHHPRLVIEVDGWTHGSMEEAAYDTSRDEFIRAEGYRVLRVSNDDVMRNVAGVIENATAVLAAAAAAQAATSTLDPSPQGGGR